MASNEEGLTSSAFLYDYSALENYFLSKYTTPRFKSEPECLGLMVRHLLKNCSASLR